MFFEYLRQKIKTVLFLLFIIWVVTKVNEFVPQVWGGVGSILNAAGPCIVMLVGGFILIKSIFH